MTGPVDKMEEPRKTRVFKSRKELVMLAGAALVFAFVIYKMYLSKPHGVPEVAQLAEAAATEDAGGGSPVRELATLLAAQESDAAERTPAPAELARDPFAMSETVRSQVYKVKGTAGTPEQTLEVIALTGRNVKEVLSKFAGGEDAAAAGLRLDAVMTSGGWKGAVVNGRVVTAGKTVLGLTLVDVLEDGVILELGKQRFRLAIERAGS